MRVGIDVTSFEWGLSAGTPIYMYHLVRGLRSAAPESTLVLVFNRHRGTAGDAILDELRGPSVQVRYIDFWSGRVPAGSSAWFPFHPGVERLAGQVDVFHAGDYLWPSGGQVPTVLSVLDLTTELFPEHHARVNRWRHRRKLRWAEREADRVVAISESTKRDLVRHRLIDPDRIDVVPLARGTTTGGKAASPADVARVRRKFGLGDSPYILTVGTIEPRKNHVRLIEAFGRISDAFPDLRLVIAGGPGWLMGAIERALEQSPAADRIHRLGFTEAEDMPALYEGATLFAYPSLYEGFGLPLLEAMAAGVAVVTSRASSLPEVAGDAALLVDPESTDDLAEGLRRLLNDDTLRRRLVEAGRRREAEFTWRRTAELTLASYRRAIHDHRNGRR